MFGKLAGDGGRLGQLCILGQSTGDMSGGRKTRSVSDRHDPNAVDLFRLANTSAPFFLAGSCCLWKLCGESKCTIIKPYEMIFQRKEYE